MLTDLSFLNVGKEFPPPCEIERLRRYQDNQKLYTNKIAEVEKFYEDLLRVERVTGNFLDVISFFVGLNYYRLITKKICDLLFGEKPDIATVDTYKSSLDKVKNNNDLIVTFRNGTKDLVKFGDAIYHNRISQMEDGSKVVKISSISPNVWFPVVNELDFKEIKYHVLAWFTKESYNDKNETYSGTLKVKIHERGFWTERTYKVKDQKIIRLVEESDKFLTGMKDFAIKHIANDPDNESIFGYDEFDDITSILSEIQVRFSQISRILDLHADPKMKGPSQLLKTNQETGESSIDIGDYIVVEEGETDPAYLTWDGKITNSLEEIEKLFSQLYILSEMSPVILGDNTRLARGQSGVSLRTLMASTILKLQRYTNILDDGIKMVLTDAIMLEGSKKITKNDITINWKDNLPVDPKEEAEIADIRTAGKATQSQLTAIRILDDKDEDAAEEELQRIQEEEAIMNPGMAFIPNPPPNDGES